MIFGEDKGKQMARSILPSQWRGAGRAKARVRRAARRSAHLAVAALVRDEDAWWDDGEDVERGAARQTRSIVSSRRGADKLNHFERWATESTRDLPREDRLGHIKALIPAGLIGQHAVTHLVRWEAFESPAARLWRQRWWGSRRAEMDRGELAQLLREILVTPDAHRALNRAIEAAQRGADAERGAHRANATPRKLLGAFDVLPFLDDLTVRGPRRLEQAMRAFCRAFKHRAG